jgi:UDP-N-acetylmuramoyl-tripeptide--D-alanyl-D-alanine ligase
MRARIVLDFLRLLALGPLARQIFLRKEREKFARPLRWLAKFYRRVFLARTRLVVVVGSLGKTTTRRALHAALRCPERGFSYSNYGATLAANLLRVRPWDHHAAIEAGIGGPGWMRVYSWFLRPDLVVVTSIKSDHHQSFPSLRHTREEKVEIVRRLAPSQVAFLNGDDENVLWMATQTRAEVVTFGLGAHNDARAINVRHLPEGVAFEAVLKNHRFAVKTRLVGEHMLYPLLAALAVAEREGVDLASALDGLARLEPADSRLAVVRVDQGPTFLDDSFKGGLETMYAALDTLAAYPSSRRKVFVFGGIETPQGNQHVLNRALGAHAAGIVQKIICLSASKNLSSLRSGALSAGMEAGAIVYVGSGIENAIAAFHDELDSGDVVLVKGKSTQRLRRAILARLGRPVRCAVNTCRVKVAACDLCPLLDASPELFLNSFISRYVRD